MRGTIPNALTLFRGVATIGIIGLFFVPVPWRFTAIFVLFILACLSDFLDGRLARKWGVVSDFGAVFDPLFDKVLILSLILLIFPFMLIHPFILLILFLRDLTTDVFKNYLLAHGTTTPAIMTAKVKTALQMLMLGLVLFHMAAPFIPYTLLVANIVGIFAVIFSLWSGYVYVRRGLSFMNRAATSSDQ